MRELEFLPAWYPQTRRRKRLVILQAWMTFVLVLGLGLYLFLAERNLRTARASLASLGGELTQTEKELRKLDELLTLQKQWQQQFEVHSKVGEHIEASRFRLKTAGPSWRDSTSRCPNSPMWASSSRTSTASASRPRCGR